MSRKILIIEDADDIVRLLKFNLEKEGYTISSISDGSLAISTVEKELPNLVLLDLMVPGKDGFSICREIKALPHLANIPIIMLTAKSDDINVVTGLELGADDYITKPFNLSVLIARIRTVMRRYDKIDPTEAPDVSLIEVGPLVIHPGKFEVSYEGTPIHLSTTELKILSCLASNAGWVFSRQQLIDYAKGDGYIVTDRMVDVLMVSIRKKLGEGAKMISTVRGAGYRIVPSD